MTAVHTSIRRHRLGLLLLSAVFTLLMALSIATPSRAFAAEAVPTCNPTATNGCVNGILQDADKKPIANVELKLSGQEEATTTTDAEGKWAFSVNADGKYTVTMDESVAKDHGLKAATAEVEIQKNSFDKARQVVRFDKPAETSSTSGTSGSGSSSTSGSSSSSTASTGDDGSAASANIGKRVWQQLFSGIIFGLMLGLMSVGMNLVYGTTGLSSFSHGEQVSLGGLMAYGYAAAALAADSVRHLCGGDWRAHRLDPKRADLGPAAPQARGYHAADDRDDRPIDGVAVRLPVLLRR